MAKGDVSLGYIKQTAYTGADAIPIGQFTKSGDAVSSPTLAAGDVRISKDGGAFNNVGTLPAGVNADTYEYAQALTGGVGGETDCDEAIISYRDQTVPSAWNPFTVVIRFATNRNSALALSSEIAALNDPSAADVADAVWNEAIAGHLNVGSTGEALDDLCCSLGPGSSLNTYTVQDGSGNPIQGVAVTVTTDVAGTNPIAYGVTDMAGEIDFWLDPGTYYMWSAKSGYTFTNPDTEVVP